MEQSDLQRLNRELAILNSIAQALNRESDLDRALGTVLAQVAELFGLRTGWVYLVRPDTGATYLAATHHLPPILATEPERLTGSCHCLDTYHEGDLDGAANVNIIRCSRLSGLIAGTDGLRFHASIPLYAQEQKLGVLNVASTDWSELSEDDLRLLYTVGDILSIAIARSHLFARSVTLGTVEERNRIAREIHDTLAQGLSAIALQLETADALLEGGPEAAQENVGRARASVGRALGLARSNLEEARRSVLDLRAAPLEGRTLRQAIAALVKETGKGTLRTRFKFVGDERPLPVHIEVGLYRIAQEALANVVRHAEARRATVRLELLPEVGAGAHWVRARLSVEDDGKGFSQEVVQTIGQDGPQPGRFGLIGLNERARLLGGELRVESEVGVGTKVTVQIGG